MPFIFVVGNSRSGTTMMGRILNNHEKVHTFPELHFFEQLWSSNEKKKVLSNEEALKLAALLLNISREGYFAKKHPQDFSKEAMRIVSFISPAEITSLKIFSSVILSEAKRNGKEFPCDQTPQNVFYIHEILEAFPDSFFINMVRDPRDVLLSQKRKWKRRFLGGTHATWYETIRAWTNYHPITISKLWNAAIRSGKNVNDTRVISVQFEELLKDPDHTIERICNQIGISFSPELKEVPHVGSSSGMDKKDVKGINTDRVQSWERGGLNNTEIWFCQRACHAYMKQLGYESGKVSPNPLLVIFYYSIFPVKLGFAFLLNIHRMKNIVETMKKRMGR
ncbi:MAG TPA: sulfotransferase [Chitinophagales bacterium]|nr:sulfotransferase [Chitinophagales bacterium]